MAMIFLTLFAIQTIKVNNLKKLISTTESQNETFTFELETKIDELDPKLIDTLTGLPNRTAFEERCLQIINFSQRFKMKFGIVFLDVEKMSLINEISYEEGNQFLKIFPSRLQKCVRQIDMVARYAGDKFIILLPQLSKPETAAYVAQRIQNNLMQPFKVNDKEILANVNMGISIYPIDGADIEILINHAHSAMLQAKEGRDGYQFYSKNIQALGNREQTLLNYFKNENLLQDISIEYKPFYNVEKNSIIYVEATPKLVHPEFGLISDAEFAKISDKSGKHWKIIEYLIHTSFLQFKKWDMQGIKPEKLAIYVPMNKIEKTDLIPAIKKLLDEIKVEPNKLVLQFNRDNITTNIESLENSLAILDKSDILVTISILALGNFALQKNMHSSLRYLKIEEELIKSTMNRQNSKIVIDKIIALANESKITVIADGIESEDEKIHLQKLGCEVMSGHLFHNPIFETNAESVNT